jgi:hypothetical protein
MTQIKVKIRRNEMDELNLTNGLLGAIVVLLWVIFNKLDAIEGRLGGIAYSVMPDRLK